MRKGEQVEPWDWWSLFNPDPKPLFYFGYHFFGFFTLSSLLTLGPKSAKTFWAAMGVSEVFIDVFQDASFNTLYSLSLFLSE